MFPVTCVSHPVSLQRRATLAHWIIDPEDRTSKPVAEVIAEVGPTGLSESGVTT